MENIVKRIFIFILSQILSCIYWYFIPIDDINHIYQFINWLFIFMLVIFITQLTK